MANPYGWWGPFYAPLPCGCRLSWGYGHANRSTGYRHEPFGDWARVDVQAQEPEPGQTVCRKLRNSYGETHRAELAQVPSAAEAIRLTNARLTSPPPTS